MLRVLVLWADHRSANLGVRVLAAGAESVIRQAFGDVDIEFQDFAPNEIGFNPGKNAVSRDLFRRSGPVKSWLRRFDLVFDTGAGDSLTDAYGAKRLLMMLYTQRATISLGIPLIFLPQTIGPFRSPILKRLTQSNLRDAAFVYARDSQSRAYAASIGISARESTDLVFGLPHVELQRSRELGLNVSGLLWQSNPHVDSNHYREQLRDLVGRLQGSNYDVTLVPHVLANATTDSDVAVIEEVAAYLGIESIFVPADLASIRDYLAGVRAVVASRMHATLNSLSLGTPSYSWAYSRKFAPLLSDVGWDHYSDLRSQDALASRTMDFILQADQLETRDELRRVRERANAMMSELVDEIRDIGAIRA